MSQKAYLLFLELPEGAICAGVYDSVERCEAALEAIGQQMGGELTEDEYQIVETEVNKLVSHPVVEYDIDEEDEE